MDREPKHRPLPRRLTGPCEHSPTRPASNSPTATSESRRSRRPARQTTRASARPPTANTRPSGLIADFRRRATNRLTGVSETADVNEAGRRHSLEVCSTAPKMSTGTTGLSASRALSPPSEVWAAWPVPSWQVRKSYTHIDDVSILSFRVGYQRTAGDPRRYLYLWGGATGLCQRQAPLQTSRRGRDYLARRRRVPVG